MRQNPGKSRPGLVQPNGQGTPGEALWVQGDASHYQRYIERMDNYGSPNRKYGSCQLCRRTTRLTFHHLIPRKLHRRNRFRKNYSREELNRGIAICRQCHNGLHLLYDEMTLAKHFSTLDALLADDAIKRHIAWSGRQKGD